LEKYSKLKYDIFSKSPFTEWATMFEVAWLLGQIS
jgi:hypothetical protein